MADNKRFLGVNTSGVTEVLDHILIRLVESYIGQDISAELLDKVNKELAEFLSSYKDVCIEANETARPVYKLTSWFNPEDRSLCIMPHFTKPEPTVHELQSVGRPPLLLN